MVKYLDFFLGGVGRGLNKMHTFVLHLSRNTYPISSNVSFLMISFRDKKQGILVFKSFHFLDPQ